MSLFTRETEMKLAIVLVLLFSSLFVAAQKSRPELCLNPYGKILDWSYEDYHNALGPAFMCGGYGLGFGAFYLRKFNDFIGAEVSLQKGTYCIPGTIWGIDHAKGTAGIVFFTPVWGVAQNYVVLNFSYRGFIRSDYPDWIVNKPDAWEKFYGLSPFSFELGPAITVGRFLLEFDEDFLRDEQTVKIAVMFNGK